MSAHRRLSDPKFLVAHFPLNNHARDVSGHGNNGTVTGATYIEGPFNGRSVMRSDGTDDKVACGNIGTVRTIAFWVNPDTTTEELILLVAGSDIMVSSGTITYATVTASATYVNGELSTTLVADVWQHVVCVLSADVAASAFGLANDGTNYGDCDLADVRAYNVALTGDEIQAVMQMDGR